MEEGSDYRALWEEETLDESARTDNNLLWLPQHKRCINSKNGPWSCHIYTFGFFSVLCLSLNGRRSSSACLQTLPRWLQEKSGRIRSTALFGQWGRGRPEWHHVSGSWLMSVKLVSFRIIRIRSKDSACLIRSSWTCQTHTNITHFTDSLS